MNLSPNDLAKKIDYTYLKAGASLPEIIQVFNFVKQFPFRGVCISPWYITQARWELEAHPIKIVSVIDFPLGHSSTKMRIEAAKSAEDLGAHELDVVMQLGPAKTGHWDQVTFDLTRLVASVKIPVKIIIETDLLTQAEIQQATLAVRNSGAEFIKTSTGFVQNGMGAKIQDIAFIKHIVGDQLKIKASGGIKTLEAANALLEAGADVLGTSSFKMGEEL